jgi:hypothetical protein
MLQRGRHFGYSKRVFGIGYAVPHWGQVMVGVSDEAFDQYFGSRGQRGDVALQEERRPAPSIHGDRSNPTPDYSGYTPAERQYFEHGDASAVQAEEHGRSPEGRAQAAALDQAQREQERETWEQFKQRKDGEVHQLVDQNARLRTRLDLFNEALQPDPDAGEVWRENYRRGAYGRSRGWPKR